MVDAGLKTPVAFIIFNRPEPTKQVFAEIARAKPRQLFVIADGPRPNRPDESERCRATRQLIDRVDWPCEVVTHYSEENLGCRNRVSSGLDWLFLQVPEAIILEDDCVPDPTFFRFCEDLLERYRDDTRVGMICGDNFQFGRKIGEGSYYFSKYTHIWGWASWRRAWRHYDVSARIWPKFRSAGLFDYMTFPCERMSWDAAFEGVCAGRIDTWDYQWTLACWSQSMLTVVPQANLITNIGFGADATHTRKINRFANMEMRAMEWPLRAPPIVAANQIADKSVAECMFKMSLLRRLKRYAFRAVGKRRATG
jgi:hypothetical protein